MAFDLLGMCRERTVLGDGAMGTELQNAGLEAGQSGEGWNLEHPDRVERIHRAYVDAGSSFVITNSFGANRWVLGRYDLDGKVEDVNRAAAAIARRAAGTRGVLGDIGPFGGLLEPLGDVAIDDVRRAFVTQARALVEGGVDGIIVETMSAVEEAVAAVQAAREAGARVVVASMAFDRKRAGLRTMMGASPADAAGALVAAGADVVGANCGTNMSAADFVEVTQAITAAVAVPIIIQSNAGQPGLVEGRVVYGLTPATFAVGMRDVVAAGAAIIGGCCGTTPDHIAACRAMLEA
jgi:5-methyltetrahydrofolate--homocysteine methyltransferase